MKKHFPPIAVCGLSALFPSSTDTRFFWRNIIEGNDLTSDVPPGHWLAEDYWQGAGVTGLNIRSKRGGFLPDVTFDPMTFGMPPNILEQTDSAQLLALLVAHSLFEETAALQEQRIDKNRISVILGVAGGTELIGEMAAKIQRPVWVDVMRGSGLAESKVQEIADKIEQSYQDWTENTFPGLLANVVAGRIANRFDLGGTNCVVDAACASSLSALTMAVHELQLGHSDLVVSGGVDALNDNFMYMCFSRTPAMSLSGDCRPFSDNADGTLLGEGIGLLALRRLEDAERDGDPIYGVIRGIGSGSDGKARSIYAPNPEGQAKTIQRAYECTPYDHSQVELIEAHGTATAAGDAAEFKGLSQTFAQNGKQRIALGSIKSQIGHTKSAAGAASLIKSIYALHHKVLPPSIKIQAPNPDLHIEQSSFYLNTHARPWIKATSLTRKASVSSFGFGGSNFHIALEEYPKSSAKRIHYAPVECFLFCADSTSELEQQLTQLKNKHESFITLAKISQSDFDASKQLRLAIIANNKQDLDTAVNNALRELQSTQIIENQTNIFYSEQDFAGDIALLFPGQGSQYLNMGAELAMEFTSARQIWDQSANEHWDQTTSLHEIVFPEPSFNPSVMQTQRETIQQTEWTQPALGACAAAQLALLKQLELPYQACAGHSYGELSALYAAQSIPDITSFLNISRQRGAAMAAAANKPGSLTAVIHPQQTLTDFLDCAELDIHIANYNGPHQTVIGGATKSIERAEEILQQRNIRFKRLAVSTAFHTPIIADAVDSFDHALQDCPFQSAQCHVYSNVSGKRHTNDPQAIRNALKQQMLSPVQFTQMLQHMHKDGIRHFIELGPSNVLQRLTNESLAEQSFTYTCLDIKGQHGLTQFWRAIGQLSVLGIPLNFRALWADYQAETMPAPASAAAISINGSNNGRQYPPTNGAAGRKAANPEQMIATPENNMDTSHVVATDHTQPTTTNQAQLQLLQQQVFEAQQQFQETLTQTHLAYLETSKQLIHGVDTGRPLAAPVPSNPTTDAHVPMQINPSVEAHAPVQSPAQESSVLDTVLDIVAEKTGYPKDMLDPDADLEAGLGIDSIKRVEILSSLQEAIPALNNIDTNELASLNTINAILAQTQHAVVETVHSTTDIHDTVLSLVAEKTGYPQDMLDLDADLEAGLGIDSIKRVEILSAIQEQVPSLAAVDTNELASLSTLREILALNNTAPTSTSNALSNSSNKAELVDVVLETVAEKTGYPKDMLDLNVDLEAGLGIDSIKRVEILSSLQEQIPELAQIDSNELASLNTLHEILAAGTASTTATQVDTRAQSSTNQIKGTSNETSISIRKMSARTEHPSGLHHRSLFTEQHYILKDADGLAAALAHALREHGLQASVVEQFPQESQSIIILPSLKDAANDNVCAAALEQFLAFQACADHMTTAGAHVVTVRYESATFQAKDPWQSGLPALGRCAAQEWASVQLKHIGIDSSQSIKSMATIICDELLYGGSEQNISISQDRTRLILCDQEIHTQDTRHPINKDDIMLVSGGARGVTAACIQQLAQQTACNFVICGRSTLAETDPYPTALDEASLKQAIRAHANEQQTALTPLQLQSTFKQICAEREVRKNIEALRSAGCTVHYRSLDISDAQAVQDLCQHVQRELGDITGIVHAAGVLADKLIAEKTADQFQTVYQCKVQGLKNILSSIDAEKLRFLNCFSSVAAYSGNKGQADYAMANEVLNQVTVDFSKQHPQCLCTSIQWGPWDGGMVNSSLAQHFKQQGIGLIPIEEGAGYFAKCFCGQYGSGIFLVGSQLRAQNANNADWEWPINVQSVPLLQDHIIQRQMVLPMMSVAEQTRRLAQTNSQRTTIDSIRNLRVQNGVQSESDSISLSPNSTATSHNEISFNFIDKNQQSRYQATAILENKTSSNIELIDTTTENSWDWDVDEIYQSGRLFHGQSFQVLKKLSNRDHQRCSGEIEHRSDPVFTLDGGLQIALLWRLQEDNKLSLPLGFDTLDFHDTFPQNQIIECRLEQIESNERLTRWNIQYVSADAQPLATLRGLEMYVVPSNKVD